MTTGTATIIDGQSMAATLRAQVAQDVRDLSCSGVTPGLAVIMVGDNPASDIYVRNKIAACDSVGIKSFEHRLPASATQNDVQELIVRLNADKSVHGILLQLPIPMHLNSKILLQAIDPAKDVDGLHPYNIGLLISGLPGPVPCTPMGCMMLVKSVRGNNLSGLTAIVIGSSLLFGKPMGQLLLNENCTLIQAHSKTRDLPDLCRRADLVFVATGQPGLVKADWIKHGATVIDIGITRKNSGSITGDVDFYGVSKVAGAITPVPGGVGPMTITCLLINTVEATKTKTGTEDKENGKTGTGHN